MVEGARGMVGLVAQTPDGKLLGLVAAHLLPSAQILAVRSGLVENHDLITTLPVPEHQRSPSPVGSCADPNGLLGEGVYRLYEDGKEAPGKVTALRGCVRVTDQRIGASFLCADLVEVSFDRSRAEVDAVDKRRREMPPLTSEDAGGLVITARAEAVGLIVAGGGYIAYVAPLRRAMEARGLILQAQAGILTPFGLTRAFNSYVDDLAREDSLDLGNMPLDAAA
jgi:hypothetical protein